MVQFNNISKHFTPFLALMILFSSISCTIDMHYCQGKLKSFSLFGKAKNCHEMAAMASCPHHQKASVEMEGCAEEDDNCCSNRTVHVEYDVDQQVVDSNKLNLETQNFIVTYDIVTSTELSGPATDVIKYELYKPPLIQKDIPVLFESFLL